MYILSALWSGCCRFDTFPISFLNFIHSLPNLTKNYTTGAVYGAGNAYPSGAPDFTPGF